MKKNKLILIILIVISLYFPISVFALSDDYEDKIYKIVNKEVEKDKVNIYFFRGEGCPHCADEEKWLDVVKKEYGSKINIYDFEVWYDEDNASLLKKVKDEMNFSGRGVPFTVIGDSYFVGYSDTIKANMENKLKGYFNEKTNKNETKIPILGKVNMKSVSIPLVATILGLIDGFNPCAMWILLFLINMLLGMKNRKKMWAIGFTFLFVSGLVYFISMLGINIILGITAVNVLKILIALFILIAGILNLRKYIKTKNEEAGCDVVDDKKRKKIITKMKKIMNEKSFMLSLIGIAVLAVSVNLVELACSLGFPVIFTEILTLNKVHGILKIIYLLIYIFFYMIDDMIVFVISMKTLEATGITNKYSKFTKLISGIIMIIMGLLLLFKPEWLMLNF